MQIIQELFVQLCRNKLARALSSIHPNIKQKDSL